MLTLLPLGAAVVLLSRRRQLDCSCALAAGVSVQPVFDERMDTALSTAHGTADALPNQVLATRHAPSWLLLILASVAILLPGAYVMTTFLPLLERVVSAIFSGLAVLLCGPYLVGQVIDRWLRSATANPG